MWAYTQALIYNELVLIAITLRQSPESTGRLPAIQRSISTVQVSY